MAATFLDKRSKVGDVDDKLITAARRTIRKGQKYRCVIPSLPQIMTVQTVTETEVHFTRKGVSGIMMMGILRFCEIAVPIEKEGTNLLDSATTRASRGPNRGRVLIWILAFCLLTPLGAWGTLVRSTRSVSPLLSFPAYIGFLPMMRCIQWGLFSLADDCTTLQEILSPARATVTLVADKRFFRNVSLTFPIHTNRIVESTPTTRPAIKPQLARSYNREATSSDGHIRMAPWFPLSAMGVVVVCGILSLVGQTRRIWAGLNAKAITPLEKGQNA